MAAAPARAGDDLQWKLDLAARSPDRVAAQARDAVRRHVTVLSLAAAGVWLFDVAQVIAH